MGPTRVRSAVATAIVVVGLALGAVPATSHALANGHAVADDGPGNQGFIWDPPCHRLDDHAPGAHCADH